MEPRPESIRSITHDIRNLLTAVRGHAELALRALAPEDRAREDVAHVVVVSSAIFDLIDQLDGNDTSETLVATNLDSNIAAMRRLLDALLPAWIELELAPAAAGAYVTISKLRVERIVINLALNARDAMDTTGELGKLSITTRRTADEQAQIIVSDTGPGFSDEALEHLFEDGFTTKPDRGGSGHGLAALARFVDGAGGSIVVDSRAGQGATVTVTLPLADLDASGAEPDDPPAAAPDSNQDDAPSHDSARPATPGAADEPVPPGAPEVPSPE